MGAGSLDKKVTMNKVEYSILSVTILKKKTYTKHGLAVNIGIQQKELQKPEVSHEEVPLSQKISRCTFWRKQFDSKIQFSVHM